MEISHLYDDIIALPHPVSQKHPHMSMSERAAQFSPFAALTGYGAAVDETARLTDSRIELSDDRIAVINDELTRIQHGDWIRVEYFTPDLLKEGGTYVSASGQVRRIDDYAKQLILTGDVMISFEDIIEIEYISDDDTNSD
jgi:hypothetical protein